MSKGNGKISAFDFEKAVMSSRKPDGEIEWNGLKIKIRSTVNFKYMFMFVEYVVKSCFDSDTGEYLPEMRDFATKSALLKYYTNIDLPNEASKQYKLLYGTDLIDCIFKSQIIDTAQFEEMTNAIKAKLKYLSDAGVNQMLVELEGAVEGIDNIVNSFSGVFDGVDNDAVLKIANAVIGEGFDENKLAKAFLKRDNDNTLNTNAEDKKEE